MTTPETTSTREVIESAIARLREAGPSRVCPPHLVHPARPGFRWVVVDDSSASVIRCANLCGWAAFAREEPDR